MSKLKEFFGLGSGHKKNKQKLTTISTDKGKLETDAIGVSADDNGFITNDAANNRLGISSEMTAQTVQQLVHDNNNSVAPTTSDNATHNNMNVNNAQQQLVMHFNNANNVHFGSVYHIKSSQDGQNLNDKPKEVPFKHPMTKKTPSIVLMMQSQVEPGIRILDTISTHLGEGWKQIMRDLGHTDGQIEQAIIDHQMHGNIREVIYQLLLQWVRGAEDNEATLGRITTLLWERRHHEVVHRMKIAWKDQQKQQQQSS